MRHLQKAVRTYFIETISQKESVQNQERTKNYRRFILSFKLKNLQVLFLKSTIISK